MNIFVVEYLSALFSGSGAREQRVCLRMRRVDHNLSRELSEGESDSTPSCGILRFGFQINLIPTVYVKY